MPVFTLYGFGTTEKFESKADKRNILSTFSRATDPTPTKAGEVVFDAKGNATLAIDGPGVRGKEVAENAKLAANAMFDWLKTELLKTKQDSLNINMGLFSRGSVTFTESLNILRDLLKEPGIVVPKDKQATFDHNIKHLRILFYANDPVSGVGDKAVESRIVIPELIIHNTVDGVSRESDPIPVDHIATLQENEMRREFKPQDKTRLELKNFEATNSVMLPFLGNHSDSMKYKNDDIADCAIINYNLMYRALSAHGTKFKEQTVLVPTVGQDNQPVGVEKTTTIPPLYGRISRKLQTDETLDLLKINEETTKDKKGNTKTTGYGEIYFDALNDKQLLEHFAKAKKNRSEYEHSGKSFKVADSIPFMSKINRTFTEQRQFYVDGSEFFMNQFERELFKKVYPKVFNYLFERGLKDNGEKRTERELDTLKTDYANELKKMKKDSPRLFKSLRMIRVGYNDISKKFFGPEEPQGDYKIETSRLTAAIEGKNYKPEFFTHQLEMLENEVVQTTMRYQRTKPEYMAFFERAHFDEATEIREEIKKISHGEGTSKAKYEKALEYLNGRYKELYQVGSESDLTTRLKKILTTHGYKYELEEKTGILQNIAAGLGHTVSYIGKSINFVANVLSTIVGLPGSVIEDTGRRLADFRIPLVDLVGNILQATGWIIRNGVGVPWLLNKIGQGIQKIGNTVINASGVYGYKTKETFTERVDKSSMSEKFGVGRKEAEEELQQKLRAEQELVEKPSETKVQKVQQESTVNQEPEQEEKLKDQQIKPDEGEKYKL